VSDYVPALRFRWLTPAYDMVVRSTTRERTFKTALLAQAGIAPGHRVLDLACGTGTLAIWIKQREPGAVVTGVDGDPEVLKIAARKTRAAGVSVVLEHALSWALPFPDGSFDRIVCTLFFHHLAPLDKVRTARELYRALNAGGELHLADWGKPTSALMHAAFLSVRVFDGFENTRDHAAGALPRYFREAGFADVAETRSLSTMFGTMTLLRAGK
jgi:ubiquinone/menaquinone biosynthesis C-methylase UbiE